MKRVIGLVAAAGVLAACSAPTGPAVITPTPPTSSAAATAATPTSTQLAEVPVPTADWANAELPIACYAPATRKFDNGEAYTLDDNGEVYATVEQPAAVDTGDQVYALITTNCTAGAGSLSLATVYRVSDDGSTWEQVRTLPAPDIGRPSVFDQATLTNGRAELRWLGYSNDSQPDYRPDILVTVQYDLAGDSPGTVIKTQRSRPALPEPKPITITPTYQVPNLIGLDRRQVWLAAAQNSALRYLGFAPAGVTVNDTIGNLNNCVVTSQAPAPGSRVKRGTLVRLRYC